MCSRHVSLSLFPALLSSCNPQPLSEPTLPLHMYPPTLTLIVDTTGAPPLSPVVKEQQQQQDHAQPLPDAQQVSAQDQQQLQQQQQQQVQQSDLQHNVILPERGIGQLHEPAAGSRSHSCLSCLTVIAAYGRLLPCKHAFCLECASAMPRCIV